MRNFPRILQISKLIISQYYENENFAATLGTSGVRGVVGEPVQPGCTLRANADCALFVFQLYRFPFCHLLILWLFQTMLRRSPRCLGQCWDILPAVPDSAETFSLLSLTVLRKSPHCPGRCWDILPAVHGQWCYNRHGVPDSAVTICMLSRTVLRHSPCCSGQYLVKSGQFL